MASKFPGRNSSHARKDAKRDSEAVKVMRLYLRGFTYREIAKKVGTHYDRVMKLIHHVRDEWTEQYAADFDRYAIEQLKKIDLVEKAAWHGWNKSLQDSVVATDGEHANTRTATQSGNPVYLKTVLDCIERRCKLLGLDAPERHALTDAAGNDIDPERLSVATTRLSEVLDALRKRAGGDGASATDYRDSPRNGANGHTKA